MTFVFFTRRMNETRTLSQIAADLKTSVSTSPEFHQYFQEFLEKTAQMTQIPHKVFTFGKREGVIRINGRKITLADIFPPPIGGERGKRKKTKNQSIPASKRHKYATMDAS